MSNKQEKSFQKIREDFYLVCLPVFGCVTRDDIGAINFYKWQNFRDSVHPDYHDNVEIPVLVPIDYIQWCREQMRSKRARELV